MAQRLAMLINARLFITRVALSLMFTLILTALVVVINVTPHAHRLPIHHASRCYRVGHVNYLSPVGGCSAACCRECYHRHCVTIITDMVIQVVGGVAIVAWLASSLLITSHWYYHWRYHAAADYDDYFGDIVG